MPDCCIQTPRQATVDPSLHRRLLDTHSKPASVSCGVTSFLLGPGVHKVLFVPSKSLFPQSCGSSVIKSHWPPKSNSLGVLSPFAGPPGWGIWCGSWNFGNSAGTSLVHRSPVCGLFARWLYGGAHMLRLSGLLQPDPLSVWQATADPCLFRRHSNTQGMSGSVSCGVPGPWCTQGFV